MLHDDDRSARVALDGGQHGDRVRSRAFGQLTLAQVLVHARRPDEATAHGRAVCAVAPSLSSARVHRRLTVFVAEVGDDFEEASEGGDVAVEDVDAGEFAVPIWLTRPTVARNAWAVPGALGHRR